MVCYHYFFSMVNRLIVRNSVRGTSVNFQLDLLVYITLYYQGINGLIAPGKASMLTADR